MPSGIFLAEADITQDARGPRENRIVIVSPHKHGLRARSGGSRDASRNRFKPFNPGTGAGQIEQLTALLAPLPFLAGQLRQPVQPHKLLVNGRANVRDAPVRPESAPGRLPPQLPEA